MKKFESDHLKERLKGIVMCTKGVISSKVNKKKQLTAFTEEEKFKMIQTGKAILKPKKIILNSETSSYKVPYIKTLINCYNYPLTKSHKKAEIFNEHLKEKETELYELIDSAVRNLIDRALLGIIPATALPRELELINEMGDLFK